MASRSHSVALAMSAAVLTLARAGYAAPGSAPRGQPAPQGQPAPDSADTASKGSDAAQLKTQGDALMDTKRYVEAIAAYEAAYAASKDPTVLYNTGRALQFLSRVPEAIDKLEQFRNEASPELRGRVPGLDSLIDDLKKRVATLDIRSSVDGARVVLGERVVGTTPVATPVRVNAGSYSLEITAEGFYPFRQQFTLVGTERREVFATLAPRTRAGELIVRSRVAGTVVTVDDKKLGVAPVEGIFDAGTHVVLVERDGYNAVKSQIVVDAGRRKDVTFDPDVRPLVSKWWFWTGIGAAVAAGVIVTLVAVNTEKDGDVGSFSPGTIRTSGVSLGRF